MDEEFSAAAAAVAQAEYGQSVIMSVGHGCMCSESYFMIPEKRMSVPYHTGLVNNEINKRLMYFIRPM